MIRRLLAIMVCVFGAAVADADVTINKSVGMGGVNDAADVKVVQELLNKIPEEAGGPSPKLDVDGLIGKKTIAAIKGFQQENSLTQDGRIDPNGRTLLFANAIARPPHPGTPIAWGKFVSAEFRDKVAAIAANLQATPDHLMAAMAFETGLTFSPSVKNAASGATGLIQFLPSTAKGLGTSTDQLAAMTAVEQLAFVEKYLTPYKGKMTEVSDVYMSILFPAAIGKPADHVLFDKDDPATKKAYMQNSGLDANNDGKITKDEAASPVRRLLERGSRKAYKG